MRAVQNNWLSTGKDFWTSAFHTGLYNAVFLFKTNWKKIYNFKKLKQHFKRVLFWINPTQYMHSNMLQEMYFYPVFHWHKNKILLFLKLCVLKASLKESHYLFHNGKTAVRIKKISHGKINGISCSCKLHGR